MKSQTDRKAAHLSARILEAAVITTNQGETSKTAGYVGYHGLYAEIAKTRSFNVDAKR